jgi:phosphatidylglycerol:prolipoprotein diacylglycerol transferase
VKPVLLSLRIGSREIGLHTYGVLIAVGLAAGIALMYREARRRGLEGGRVLDLAFWVTVAGLLGSRLTYGLVNAREFARLCAGTDSEVPRGLGRVVADCGRILQVWEGGLVFYGGLVSAAAVTAWFAWRQRWSIVPRDGLRSAEPSSALAFWLLGDICAPGLALGHAIGRLGCFAAGCCFGKLSTGALGVAFPRGSVAFDELAARAAVAAGASFTPPLHPTQLYEAAGELAIFGALLALRPRVGRRPGALLLTYVALYCVLRFVVELFRGDPARGYLVRLSTPRLAAWLHLPLGEPILLSVGQAMSIAVLLGTVALFMLRRGQQRGG